MARVKQAQDALKKFIPMPTPRKTTRSNTRGDATEMGWRAFVEQVRAETANDLDQRLEVLATARQYFAKGIPFWKLPELERKAIAGVLGKSQRAVLDWGYFGQMSVFGGYPKALREQTKTLSRALDQVPLVGAVHRHHFDAFCKEYYRTAGASPTWMSLATRLLAMKRPDQFVCIDSRNRVDLCSAFGTPPWTTRLDNYWDRIIEPMRIMPWWLAPMPKTVEQQQIWLGRAAMLDAIYYDPKN